MDSRRVIEDYDYDMPLPEEEQKWYRIELRNDVDKPIARISTFDDFHEAYEYACRQVRWYNNRSSSEDIFSWRISSVSEVDD